jgi:hypothetical protein
MRCPKCGYEHEQANSNEGPSVGAFVEGQSGDLFGERTMGLEAERSTSGESGVGNGKTPVKRRTQLSPTWQPTDEQKLYCRQQGKDPDAMAEAFKGYYQAKGSVWLNWNLVWMKACREWKNSGLEVKVAPENIEKERLLSQWRARLSVRRWNPFWGPKPGEPGCQVPKELWP